MGKKRRPFEKGIVVLQPGFEVEEEDLIEHCKGFPGSYKKPQAIEFVEALPKPQRQACQKGAQGEILG